MELPTETSHRTPRLGPALSWLSLLAHALVGTVFLFGEGNVRYPNGVKTFWGFRIESLIQRELLIYDAVLLAPFVMAGAGVVLCVKAANSGRAHGFVRSFQWMVLATGPGVVVLALGLWDLLNNS